MSKVGIHVNNKLFTIACDDGQEARVKQLGQYIDERFRELGQAGAAPNESYMLVLTSLVIADEMFDARDAAEKANMSAAGAHELEAQIQNQRAEYAAYIQNLEAQLAAAKSQIAALESDVATARADVDAAVAQAVANAPAAAPVVDLDAARAQWMAEARTKEHDIAKVVDALAGQLEVVVKGLKRAS